MPLNDFDIKKHRKLCEAVKGRIPPTDYEDLENVPEYLNSFPTESFEALLKRIDEKVMALPAISQTSADPENEAIDAFLKSGVIERIWDTRSKPQSIKPQGEGSSGSTTASPLIKEKKAPRSHSSASQRKTIRKSEKEQPINALRGRKRKQPDDY